MKMRQWLLLLMVALLLIACTALGSDSSQGSVPPQGALPAAPSFSWQPAGPMPASGTTRESAPSQEFASPQAILSPMPSPFSPPTSPTPVPTPIPLCPQISSEVGWQCQEDQWKHTRTCGPAAPSKSGWACYEDLIYGFAMEYPLGLNVEIPIDIDLQDDVKIARRHSFWGPQGALDVDIWRPSDPDLTRWLERMKEATGPDLVPFTEPNARVAGYPAVAFVMGDPQNPSPMFSVYLSNGRYGYHLWFTLRCDREELARIHRILDTFRFSAQPVPSEIPEGVWHDVERAYEPSRCGGQ